MSRRVRRKKAADGKPNFDELRKGLPVVNNFDALYFLFIPGPYEDLSKVELWAPVLLRGTPAPRTCETPEMVANRLARNTMEVLDRGFGRPESGYERFCRRLGNLLEGEHEDLGDPRLMTPPEDTDDDGEVARCVLARIFLTIAIGSIDVAEGITGWNDDDFIARQALLNECLDELTVCRADPTGYARWRLLHLLEVIDRCCAEERVIEVFNVA